MALERPFFPLCFILSISFPSFVRVFRELLWLNSETPHVPLAVKVPGSLSLSSQLRMSTLVLAKLGKAAEKRDGTPLQLNRCWYRLIDINAIWVFYTGSCFPPNLTCQTHGLHNYIISKHLIAAPFCIKQHFKSRFVIQYHRMALTAFYASSCEIWIRRRCTL